MIWDIDQESTDGIMFSGQKTVNVINKRTKQTGLATVQYSPVCCLIGPVVARESDPNLWPPERGDDQQRIIIDKKPIFR